MIRGGNKTLLHRQLKQFLMDMEAEYGDLALYNQVSWFSAEKCLERFFGIRKELPAFNDRIELFNNPLCVDIENQQANVQHEIYGLQTRQEKGPDFIKLLSKNRFPNLHAFGHKMTSMFGNTYICKSVFSPMKFIKNHNRSRLMDSSLLHLLRLAMTELHVDIPALVSAAERPQS
ncbi:general transcription factor II-I repeat domain-containing protein 2-like [Tachypleus tridentatus]|uniref:general transcription factor II-I repeat domain-containing protein 2-like n=1 Tax=Tachypleus tridentatus TaxID=6853 RepID=UPI003FCF472D